MKPPGRASLKGVRGCLTPQPSTRHRRPASQQPQRFRPGGAASANRKKSRTGWLFIAPFALVFVAFLILPLVYAFYLSLYSKGLATGVVFVRSKNYAHRLHRPVVPSRGVVRPPVCGGTDPGASARLARGRAGAGRPYHLPRAVRAADDLPPFLRDSGGDRGLDVGSSTVLVWTDATAGQHLRRERAVPAQP